MGSSAADGARVRSGARTPAPGAVPPSRDQAARDRGRAFGLGPGALFASVAAALLVLVAVLLLGASGSTSANGGMTHGKARATAQPAAHYGGLPSWLPKPKLAVRRVLHARVAHPALSIEGEAIAVDLPAASVLATAVGPEVPEEGRFPVPAVSPCTFILTFSATSHPIPLEASQFTLVDERGFVHHPKLTSFDGGPAPREIPSGRTLSVKLHDILPTGDGGLRWAPTTGRPLATWDYTVEID